MRAVFSALKLSGNGVFVAQTDGKIVAYEITIGSNTCGKMTNCLNRNLSNPVMLGQDLVVGDLDGVLALDQSSDR